METHIVYLTEGVGTHWCVWRYSLVWGCQHLPQAMKRKRLCCIPGCSTYDHRVNLIPLPLSSDMRLKWIEAIPDLNKTVDYESIICVKHFRKEDFLKLITNAPKPSNKRDVLKDNIPIRKFLKDDAIPSIFVKRKLKLVGLSAPELPQHMLQIRERDEKGLDAPDTFGDIQNAKKTDYVIAFWYFKLHFQNRLKDVLSSGPWLAQSSLDLSFVYFHCLDTTAPVPRILTSIHVDSNLIVTVALDGKFMDPTDLTWCLPVHGTLTRWSQLKQLIKTFTPNKSCKSELQTLVSFVSPVLSNDKKVTPPRRKLVAVRPIYVAGTVDTKTKTIVLHK